MHVQAAPGLKVPKEGKPRQYITAAVEVPDTAYYRRLVADGSLVPTDPSLPAEAQSEGGSDRSTKKKEL